MRRRLAAALCAPVLGAAALAYAAAPAGDPLLDASADVEVARTPVPSAVRRVGEVHVVRRGPAVVVQTRLETTILRRAVGEIRKKERANWPAETPGHDDAERYVAALADVAAALPRPSVEPRADRRQRLLIEFVLGAERALVAIGAFEYAGSGAAARPTWRAAPTVLELERDYVHGNMQRIVADAFEDAATRARLATLLGILASPSPAGGRD